MAPSYEFSLRALKTAFQSAGVNDVANGYSQIQLIKPLQIICDILELAIEENLVPSAVASLMCFGWNIGPRRHGGKERHVRVNPPHPK